MRGWPPLRWGAPALGSAEVVHAPSVAVPAVGPAALVVTVHDAAPLLWDDRGHGMVFRDFNDRLLLCLHRYFRQPRTRVQLWELVDEGDDLRLEGQLLGAR